MLETKDKEALGCPPSIIVDIRSHGALLRLALHPIPILDRLGSSLGPSMVKRENIIEAILLVSEHLLKHAEGLKAFGISSFGVVMRLMKEGKPLLYRLSTSST